MIPTSLLLDQSSMARLGAHDRVVGRNRQLFALCAWELLPTRAVHLPGSHSHP